MKKRLLNATALACALTLGVTLFAGCKTGGSESSKDGNKPKDKTTVRYNLGADPKTLDPALNTAVDGATVLQNLYVGLMKTDEKEQPVPGVAQSYEISADKLTYTFKLRDSKWSDGKPVTAEQFKYAWLRALDPKTQPVPAEYAYQMFYIKNGEKFYKGQAKPEEVGIEVPDAKTIRVTLEAPCPYFLALTAFPTYFPVRQDMIEKDVKKWWTAKETAISNGPFKLESLAPKSKLVLVKNPEYYDAAKVKLEKVDMDLTDDRQTALAAYTKGELDMMESPPPQDIPKLLKEKKAVIAPYLGTYFYVINMRPSLKTKNPAAYEALSKPQVRKALALAIDKKSIIDNVSKGGQTPAWGFVPMGIKDDKLNDFAMAKKYMEKENGDPEQAKKLLADAGYPDGKGFPKLTLKYNNNVGHQNMAIAIQDMWKKTLGIDIQLSNEEWAVFQSSRNNGDFEIARHGWIADYNDPMSFLDMWISGEGEGVWGNNDAHFKNDRYDDLIRKARVEIDLAKRTQLLHEAEAILMEEMPILPIYFYTNVLCFKDYVKGVRKSPLGFLYFETAYIE
ncbi:Oligopeptide ABC transporter, periplasmic oligopeptide-binding protein OppA [Clostridiaceae bacterium JG1575]|nr:Oligopeptide ABC transporter, periplasmic oligopeptide-binding protein OppA [Clostridiaceae bacterium JG1575]